MKSEVAAPPESVRLSKRCRDQLIALKRKTGISQWNILCRWALATSLAMPTEPPITEQKLEGGIEMSWRVFAGSEAELWWAALLMTEPEDPSESLRAHIDRGINQLSSSIRGSITELVAPAIADQSSAASSTGRG